MDEVKRELKVAGLVAGAGALVGAVIVYRFGASQIVVLLMATLALVGLTVLRRQGVDFLVMMAAVVLTAYIVTQNVYVAVAAAVVVVLIGFFGRQAMSRPRAQQQVQQQVSGEEEEGGARVVTEVRGLGRGLDPQRITALHATIDRGSVEGELAKLVLTADLASEAVRKGVNPERVAQILAQGGEVVAGEQPQPGLQVPKLKRGRARGLFGGGR